MQPTVTAIVLTAVLVLMASKALAESDSFGASSFHPFTMDPFNSGCESSTHTLLWIPLRNCDPVNVIFDNISVNQASAALQSKGWTLFGFGSMQWLHPSNEESLMLQSVQLYKYIGPGVGPCPADVSLCRYHIRLWPMPEVSQAAAGAVHFEAGDFFNHELSGSWELAEEQLCRDFDSLDRFLCQANEVPLPEQAAIQASDSWRASEGFSGLNNARASLIRQH